MNLAAALSAYVETVLPAIAAVIVIVAVVVIAYLVVRSAASR